MLVDGKWSAEWHPLHAKDKKGGFVRQTVELPQLRHAGWHDQASRRRPGAITSMSR